MLDATLFKQLFEFYFGYFAAVILIKWSENVLQILLILSVRRFQTARNKLIVIDLSISVCINALDDWFKLVEWVILVLFLEVAFQFINC